jgi:hypothetical protein
MLKIKSLFLKNLRSRGVFFCLGLFLLHYQAAFGQAPFAHDVAVTALSSQSWVIADSTLSTSIEVANKGDKVEEISVFLIDSAFNDTIEQWFPVIEPNTTDTTVLFWNTKGAQSGKHTFIAVAVIASDANPGNNKLSQSVTVVPYIHDVSVSRIEPSRKAVVSGDSLMVLVGLKNLGPYVETASVKVSLEGNSNEANKTVVLEPASDTSVFFMVKAQSQLQGEYTLRAEVAPLPRESSVENNAAWTMLTVVPQSAITVSSFDLSLAKRKSGADTYTHCLAAVVFASEKGPCSGATVWGVWNGAVSTSAGKTDTKGRVVMTSPEVKNAVSGSQFTFTIVRVVPADNGPSRMLLGPTVKTVAVP